MPFLLVIINIGIHSFVKAFKIFLKVAGVAIFSSGFGATMAYGQQNFYTLSGNIKDSINKELLTGVVVLEPALKFATRSDTVGRYSINLQPGEHTLIFQFAGYASSQVKLTLTQDTQLEVNLIPEVTQQREVVVEGNSDVNVTSTEIGIAEIKTEDVKNLPVLLGEVDLLKTLQLLPGVQASGEGNTGIYVRGGGPDQNLVLIDDAVVYNTGHLFGFLSVFNGDAIKAVTLYKGNMPASYGGRISSVVDFTTKDGNAAKIKVQGGIGLIASRLAVEGPLIKDKLNFSFAGRRTYIDQISKPFFKREGQRGLPYYFYDLNGKVNYNFSQKSKISLSGYTGTDYMRLILIDGRLDARVRWGNQAYSGKWNYTISEKSGLQVAAIISNYRFSSVAKFDNFNTDISSNIIDYTLKSDLNFKPTIRHDIGFGISYTYHKFTPRRTEASASSTVFEPAPNSTKQAQEVSIYLHDNFNISEKIRLSAGIRNTLFQQIGPYLETKEVNGNIDTTVFKNLKPVKTFFNPEPRLGLRYLINASSSIKTAFNINYQYIHLVSLSGNALPFDIWVPSSNIIQPQKGWQYSIGYFKNFSNNLFECSAEMYYKNLQNLIEYRQDYVPAVTGEIEQEFVFGRGRSYGLELFFKKRLGRINGWVGYTLARASRQFLQINDGSIFPARYDRRHDLSVVSNFVVNKHWTLGGIFVFASGQAITIPERRYVVEANIYNQYGQRNSFRMQPYHRLDFSATYERNKATTKFQSSWTFAVYNVYNRKNPYIYFVDTQGDISQGKLTVKAKKLFLFPVLPSVTWNFKF